MCISLARTCPETQRAVYEVRLGLVLAGTIYYIGQVVRVARGDTGHEKFCTSWCTLVRMAFTVTDIHIWSRELVPRIERQASVLDEHGASYLGEGLKAIILPKHSL